MKNCLISGAARWHFWTAQVRFSVVWHRKVASSHMWSTRCSVVHIHYGAISGWRSRSDISRGSACLKCSWSRNQTPGSPWLASFTQSSNLDVREWGFIGWIIPITKLKQKLTTTTSTTTKNLFQSLGFYSGKWWKCSESVHKWQAMFPDVLFKRYKMK